MARRLHQTMADYVVIAISPALIMALVGSLVFFLLQVFYQGEFQARLHWVMACFVFAAVLIGRISIEEGFERAAPFGAALAIVVGIAANRFMEYQGGWIDHFSWAINWTLIAVVWWCAHRLTWDCTVIDDSQDSSGAGLLQIAGLEPAQVEADNADDKRVEGTTSRQVPASYWQRFVEHQRRPHAPGVWVVYFSLAALPLFGIGQWLIPESDVVSRRYAFWLLCVYVASGMGLLLTTSFLGLRRYLRQRRIEMPTLMANLWLSTGTVVIAILLVLAALLPRPSAEYSISRLPFTVGSPEQGRSRLAPIPQEGTRDEQPGTAPERQANDDPRNAKSADATPRDSDAPKESKGQDTAEQSADKSSQREHDPQSAAQGSKGRHDGTSKPDGDRPQASRENSSGSKQADGPRDRKSDRSPPQSSENESKEPSDLASKFEKAKQDRQEQKDAAAAQSKPPVEAPSQQAIDPSRPLETVQSVVATTSSVIALVLQWVFYAVLALAVLYGCWRYRAEILAAIREFWIGLRDFWYGLLGNKRRHAAAASGAVEIKMPPAPFSMYDDPFASGSAGHYPIEELVRYSFEAFEAWAREHGCPRHVDQTPHELARDVAKLNAFITADARNLAELYARAAYARGELPAGSGQQLQQLWQTMRQNMASSL